MQIVQVAAEDFGDLLPGVVQRSPGPLPGLVRTGGVGKAIGLASRDGLYDFRPGRRRGVVVEVDGFHSGNYRRKSFIWQGL